jgi:threonine aldolase
MKDVIDLRSDTVTLPSEEMRKAMAAAKLGDDVYGEDPTVNQLQDMSAAMLGKEAGLFVASGTMGNVVALLTHCGRGGQVIAGDLSHIVLHEAGAAGVLGGLFLRNVRNTRDGQMNLDHLADVMHGEDDVHKAKTAVVCVENTFHGQALPLDYLHAVQKFSRDRGVKTHLDGARIFNAAVKMNVKVAELTSGFDSIQFCFSKGLASPVGSMLCGSSEFIARARAIRKLLGGGMRQVGVLAAACRVSLEKMVGRLEQDHVLAQILAEQLGEVPGIIVQPAVNRTNMVFFKVAGGNEEQEAFANRLCEAGVLCFAEPPLGIRAVTHYGLEASHIKEAVNRIAKLASSHSPSKVSV